MENISLWRSKGTWMFNEYFEEMLHSLTRPSHIKANNMASNREVYKTFKRAITKIITLYGDNDMKCGPCIGGLKVGLSVVDKNCLMASDASKEKPRNVFFKRQWRKFPRSITLETKRHSSPKTFSTAFAHFKLLKFCILQTLQHISLIQKPVQS